MPGFVVMPLRMFQSVVKGTPESFDNSCVSAWPSPARACRTTAIGGKFDFMKGKSTRFGSYRQPDSVASLLYLMQMRGMDPKAVLWGNLEALMKKQYGAVNTTRLAADSGVSVGSIGRIKAQTTSVGLDILKELAAHFNLEPWQLLVPGLDIEAPPTIQVLPATGLLMPMVDQARYHALPEQKRILIQGYVNRLLDEHEPKVSQPQPSGKSTPSSPDLDQGKNVAQG